MGAADYPLVMRITSVYQVHGVGTVVRGRVTCDEVRFRDMVLVVGEAYSAPATVGGIETGGRTAAVARRGDEVAALLMAGRPREQIPEVQEGMRVYLTGRPVPSGSDPPEGSEAPVLGRRWWRFWE